MPAPFRLAGEVSIVTGLTRRNGCDVVITDAR
jgi:hypothetical protein